MHHSQRHITCLRRDAVSGARREPERFARKHGAENQPPLGLSAGCLFPLMLVTLMLCSCGRQKMREKQKYREVLLVWRSSSSLVRREYAPSKRMMITPHPPCWVSMFRVDANLRLSSIASVACANLLFHVVAAGVVVSVGSESLFVFHRLSQHVHTT